MRRTHVWAGLMVGAIAGGWLGIGRLGGGEQIPLSQFGSVGQRLAEAEIRVLYHRPVARGRAIFGGIVPYGEVWNPGADQATRLETTHDLLVAGRPLPAGKYSIWAVPDPEEWTLIFSRAWDVYHVPYPEGQDALRIRVAPEPAEHMETLAFYFPLADRRKGALALHWGETRVVVPLEVPNVALE